MSFNLDTRDPYDISMTTILNHSDHNSIDDCGTEPRWKQNAKPRRRAPRAPETPSEDGNNILTSPQDSRPLLLSVVPRPHTLLLEGLKVRPEHLPSNHRENLAKLDSDSPGSSISGTSPTSSASPHLGLTTGSTFTTPAHGPQHISLPSEFPAPALPKALGNFFSLETRIAMTLCGEIITYDLEELDNDPKTIIALLKATTSAQGNWMVVAGHYRRKGNAVSAIQVIETMIEVMAEHDIHEKNLKPAFLMLSGCESDMARTESDCPAKSQQHFKKSIEWVQKVYGVQVAQSNEPGTECPTNSVLVHANTNVSPPASATAMLPKKPAVPSPGQSFPSEISTRNIFPLAHPSGTEGQASQKALLEEVRSSKRRLEDELRSERNMRRKLERNIDELREELATARKMEANALRREDETRRRAEENVRQEKKRMEELERNDAVRPLFENLANLFQRAAQGEGIPRPANDSSGNQITWSPFHGRGF